MTGNERFWALGRLDEFDEAALRRDREKMIEICRDAEIEAAEEVVDRILASPDPYRPSRPYP
jgi:hypothetical protein